MIACQGQTIRPWRILMDVMSTAIARIYVPEGFVVAADGRVLDSETELILTDRAQKIIPLRHPRGQMACAFAGAVCLTHKNSDDVVFNLRDETCGASQCTRVALREHSDLHRYVDRLATEVFSRMKISAERASFPECQIFSPYGEKGGFYIAKILVDGYYGGLPGRATVEFWHINQIPQEPVISHLEQPPDRGLTGHGSQAVFDALDNDPRFKRFGLSKLRWKDRGLDDAISKARKFLLAHMGKEGSKVDPENCAAVGGHIHIATVTRDMGFIWASGYEPLP